MENKISKVDLAISIFMVGMIFGFALKNYNQPSFCAWLIALCGYSEILQIKIKSYRNDRDK